MANKPQFSAAAVAEALLATAGIKTAAAKRVGCSTDTIDRYIARYPTVAQAYKEARASIIDKAESVLLQRLNNGEWDAAKFVLTTIGRDRGWGTKTDVELSGPDGAPLVFTMQIDRRDDDGDDDPAN